MSESTSKHVLVNLILNWESSGILLEAHPWLLVAFEGV